MMCELSRTRRGRTRNPQAAFGWCLYSLWRIRDLWDRQTEHTRLGWWSWARILVCVLILCGACHASLHVSVPVRYICTKWVNPFLDYTFSWNTTGEQYKSRLTSYCTSFLEWLDVTPCSLFLIQLSLSRQKTCIPIYICITYKYIFRNSSHTKSGVKLNKTPIRIAEFFFNFINVFFLIKSNNNVIYYYIFKLYNFIIYIVQNRLLI